MTDTPDRGPRKGAGLNELRLQAATARDELAATLDAIERKVTPVARIIVGAATVGALTWGAIRFASADLRSGRFGRARNRRG